MLRLVTFASACAVGLCLVACATTPMPEAASPDDGGVEPKPRSSQAHRDCPPDRELDMCLEPGPSFDPGCVDWKTCIASGNAAWQRGDTTVAAADYRHACAEGPPAACAQYAITVERGVGDRAPDLFYAIDLYEWACARDVPEACFNLALMQRDGRGQSVDTVAADQHMQRACSLGLTRACKPAPTTARAPAPASTSTPTPADDDTALAPARAAFDRKDWPAAARLYANLCDKQNILLACTELGDTLSQQGKKAEAFARWLSSCEAGEPWACVSVSYAVFVGDGAPMDHDKAFAYAARACNDGAGAGCAMAGSIGDLSHGDAYWYEKGCALEDAASCKAAAEECDFGGAGDGPLKAKQYRAFACKYGDADSCRQRP